MRTIKNANEPNDGLEEVIILARPVDPAERQGGMRLNMEMKKEVVNNAIEHAFSKRYRDVMTEETSLQRECWMKCFGKATLAHAKALGQPFMADPAKDRYGNVSKDGLPIQFSISGQYYNLRGRMPQPFHGFPGGIKELRIKEDPDLLERVRAMYDARKKIDDEVIKVRSTLEAMLQRITTYPSLEKNWPAGKKFYQHLPKKYPFRHQVPAVLIDELNAALGI
jgi:hypothetical protein